MRNLDQRLERIERRLERLRAGIPGSATIAIGVFLGLVLYSTLGVLCSIVLWSMGITLVGAMADSRKEPERPIPAVEKPDAANTSRPEPKELPLKPDGTIDWDAAVRGGGGVP